MDTKKVTCPSCGVGLKVTNSKNEAVKIIACPNCGSKIEVDFEEGMTVFGTNSKTSRAMLLLNGQSFELQMGANIVGRQSSLSEANVKLPVNDPYMSRLHALIRVNKVNDTLCVTLSNYKNKNATLVNGVELRQSDEVVLNQGDEIVMGDTSMKIMTK
jgi:hypothetical protein